MGSAASTSAKPAKDVVLAKGSGRLAVSDVSKFRAACRSMVASFPRLSKGRREKLSVSCERFCLNFLG